MSNVDNTNGAYYLLLSKLAPDAHSKIAGAITIESDHQNKCTVEVDVSSGDNRYAVNNLCDDAHASMVTVQYREEAYIAVELMGIMDVTDISFNGPAANRALTLVNENEVEVIGDTRAGSTLETELGISDTRNVDDLPNFASKKFRLDAKLRTTINVPGSGAFSTSMTISPWGDASGGYVHQLNFNNGGIYYRTGVFNSPTWNVWRKFMTEDESGNVGIGMSSFPAAKLFINGNLGFHQPNNGTNGIIWKNSGNSYQKISAAIKPVDFANYAGQGLGFFTGDFLDRTTDAVERMRITRSGNVGIGTDNPTHKLTVAGTIGAREVIVDANTGADFVFAPDYRLRPLSEVEQFIAANRHLPEIAPADEMAQNGVNMGEFQIQLLQKIEELTLYVIEQQKQIEELREELRIKN